MRKLEILLKITEDKINNYKVCYHNEYTYSYDKAYLKCLRDYKELIEKLLYENN